MEVMSGTGALVLIAGVLVALFIYGYISNQGWTGQKGL